jgi:hypothetical protein
MGGIRFSQGNFGWVRSGSVTARTERSANSRATARASVNASSGVGLSVNLITARPCNRKSLCLTSGPHSCHPAPMETQGAFGFRLPEGQKRFPITSFRGGYP